MNLKEIKELLQLMAEHGLAEIEIEKDGSKIKLKKTAGGQFISEEMQGSHPVLIPIPKAAQSAASSGGPQSPSPAAAAEGITVVRSPMVGTYYAAPAPDQPSYVSVGQTINEGDVLCVLEAMKLMNEIKSEVRGTLVEIMVQNGQAVEFDQPLFKIKRA